MRNTVEILEGVKIERFLRNVRSANINPAIEQFRWDLLELELAYCRTCDNILPKEEFYKFSNSPFKVSYDCIACHKFGKRPKDYRLNTRYTENGRRAKMSLDLEEFKRDIFSEGLWYCHQCGELKTHDNFSKNTAMFLGLVVKCKDCEHPGRRPMADIIKKLNDLYDKGLFECKKCNKIKTLDHFVKDSRPGRPRGGYTSPCKECRATLTKEAYLRRTSGIVNRRHDRKIIDGKIRCTKCNKHKLLSEFYPSKGKFGVLGPCKLCYRKDPKRIAASRRSWTKFREKRIPIQKKRSKQYRENLEAPYVKAVVKRQYGIENPTDEMVEFKKAIMALRRLAKAKLGVRTH